MGAMIDGSRSGAILGEIAVAALKWWCAQERPLVGAFVYGSSARRGCVAPSSDIDLCIIVPTVPDPAWFGERLVGSYTVEISPLDAACLTDPETILASPSLPFNLCEAIIIHDSDGLLHTLRARLAPHLCMATYRRARTAICYEQACDADVRVREALDNADLARAQHEVTLGLWHALGIDSAIACRCPTNRRGFVCLWQDAARWKRPDLITFAQQALGCTGLTKQDARLLADAAGQIKGRYRQGILAMVEQGEVEQAVWPLLHAALWRSAGSSPRPDARQHILTALNYDSLSSVRKHQEAVHELTASLWEVAQSLAEMV